MMPNTKYIKRKLEEKIKRLAKTFPSVVVTGPRQSGKSTMVKKIFGKTHKYITFDDPLTRQKCEADSKMFLEEAGENIILDEAQYVPKLLSYIKMNIDEKRNRNGRYIITGSQQFNMIKGLGDTLAGRVAVTKLFPISYCEAHKANVKTDFFSACLRGSFPEMMIKKTLDAGDWFGSYLNTYLERDIRGLNNVGSLREFRQFLGLLAARCSQILDINSIASDIGVAVNTVKNWISMLEASQMIIVVPSFYRNLGKRITKRPKVYFIDCGLVSYFAGIKTKEQLLNGPMAGQMFENYVFSEVYKNLSTASSKSDLFYYRTSNGVEVDMLIESNASIQPIEIKLSKTPNRNMAAPIEKFITDAEGKLKVIDGRIICLANGKERLTSGVSSENIYDFLLNHLILCN